MVSMRDIAEEAGVSIATVSHVLNHTRKVSSGTLERVLKVSRAMGYTPAAHPRANGRPEKADDATIGMIVSDIQNPFFTETIKGFQDQARIHNIDVIITDSNYDPLRTHHNAKRLMRLGVAGVAVLATEPHHLIQDLLSESRICTVYIDSSRVGPYIGSLNLDYAEGIRLAVEHLKAQGHERIGYIGSQLTVEAVQARKRAFIELLPDKLMAAQLVIDTEGTVEGGYFACSKLISRCEPTAIVCSNDLLAIGSLHYTSDQGIQVPRQLSVIGFDNIHFSKFTMPELTTVDLPKLECGATAFDLLSQMLENESHEGKSVAIKPQLVIRQSTGPVAA